ncbi:MAG: Ni/Fe hydrogenase subunit alpha [Chromatiaceae bacterium]|nr:Ni/Fe hydrogenase subunit alpha [Chromatiaceae bacterium]
MASSLETAAHPERLKRVVIEPLSRVEGHGKVTLLQDEENRIRQVRLHIVEFRGFEKFVQGRPYWELPVLVQRLCGICPVSHHLAAAKATDQLVGVDQLTPTAEKIRRLMHLGQTLQSHALHFFHLSSPDLLFGFDDAVAHRNIVGLIQDHPELARRGVLLRKYGQEVIRLTAGKRIHGSGAIPGGINKSLTVQEREFLVADIDQLVQWAEESVQLIKRIFMQHPDYHYEFAKVDANTLSMIRPDGAFEIYHGGLRARNADGETIFDQVDYRQYEALLKEAVKPWSYMKFPFIADLGPEAGWFRVGPLARVNNCDRFDMPLAEQERHDFMAAGEGRPLQAALATHWARLIELLYCAEAIEDLLADPDLSGGDLRIDGAMREKGIGVLEAPRGTLFHHYEIDGDGLVRRANLIVATTNNNQVMNESIRQVANAYLDGKELTEPLLNQIEVAIRAYDPCLSCATHALGKMPLRVELVDAAGELVDIVYRDAGGGFGRVDPMTSDSH